MYVHALLVIACIHVCTCVYVHVHIYVCIKALSSVLYEKYSIKYSMRGHVKMNTS